jgi:phosphatidylglycerophosphatase GEP4
MAYFKAHPDAGVTSPSQIAVVGDRLSTDIMMANMMGSYGVWVRDGVTGRGFVSTAQSCSRMTTEQCLHCRALLTGRQFARMEDRLQSFLFRRGYSAPDPASHNHFE